MQRVVACMQGMSVDVSEYKRKRDMLCQAPGSYGYDFTTPPGTFYLFPQSPIADELNVKPEEIVFQSSNAWDACGAAAFGLKVAWVNRFGQIPERLPDKPDVEIKVLSELPELLI